MHDPQVEPTPRKFLDKLAADVEEKNVSAVFIAVAYANGNKENMVMTLNSEQLRILELENGVSAISLKIQELAELVANRERPKGAQPS